LNQRSAEVKLITAMLSIEGGFAETKLKGITAEHFNLFGEVYKFICDHEATYNSLPSKGMIIEKFTDFIFAKREFSSISDVVYYVDIVKNFYVKKMAERIISEGIDKLKVEDPTEAVRFMTESLLKVHKPNIRMSHTDHDVGLRLEEFVERKKQIERGESIGIKTGLSMFDEKMMGWQPGDLIVVYGPPQVGKCEDGDTLVLDASGRLIKIKDITDKNIVISMDERTLKLVENKNPKLIYNGKRIVHQVVTSTGREIKITENHPLFTINGWKKLSELKVGDRIACPRELPYFGSYDIEDYKLSVLGFLLGDGYLGSAKKKSDCPKLSATDKNIIDKYSKCVELFGDKVVNENGNYVARPKINQKGIKTYTLGKVAQWLRELELIGIRSKDKFLPDFVFELPKDKICVLLAALWDTDGEVSARAHNSKYIGYCTISDKFRQQVSHLLLRLGILNYSTYILDKENLNKFNSLVGKYMVSYKRDNLNKLIKLKSMSSRIESSRIESFPKDMWQKIVDNRSDLCVKVSHHARGSMSNWLKTRGISRNIVRRFADLYDSEELRTFSNSDLIWDKIVSIKEIGERDVYDLSLKDNHNFVANDIITHNSWLLEYFGIMAYLDGKRVLFISTEMSYQEVNLRWDTIAARKLGFDLPNEALLTGSDMVKLSTYKAWVEKAQQRDDWLTVDSAEGDNFRVSTVEGLVDSFHPDVVCCDTLPLFCDSQGKLGVNWESLLEIGYGLKSLASRRNLVIITTNPSTGDTFDQDKPAGLSGIAFSRAGLPFAASVMISINYDKMDPIGHRQIAVTKKRHGKAIGGARKIVYDLDKGIIGDV
jgi:intein/homing endonuclease